MSDTSSVLSIDSFLMEEAVRVLVRAFFVGVDVATVLTSDSSEDESSLRLAVDFCLLDRLTGELSGVAWLRFLLWVVFDPAFACIGDSIAG